MMKSRVVKLLSLLLVLTLLLGMIPSALAVGPEGETELDFTQTEANEPPAWDEVEPTVTCVPPAEADPYWLEIAAFEAERLPDEPTRADYAALVPEVAALVETLPGFVPDSISYSDDGFFWRMEDRGAYGYFPEDRVWTAPGDLAEPTGGQIAVYDFSGGVDWRETAELLEDTNTTSNPNVAVFEPQIGFDDLFDDGHPLEPIGLQIAAYTGGVCTVYTGNAVTVDSFANAVAECGVVLINTHGRSDIYWNKELGRNVGTSYICLNNRDGLTSEDKKVLWRDPEDSSNWYSHAYLSGTVGCLIDGTAIVNHMGGRTSSNGLVWLAACQTYKTDGLAAPLRAQGVGVVYGHTRSVSHSGSVAYYQAFFRSLMTGVTVSTAAWEMKKEKGYWDKSFFHTSDAKNFSTYAQYRDHRSQGWAQRVKRMVSFWIPSIFGQTWQDYTEKLEDSLTEHVRYVDGYDNDGVAFPLFASKDEDPYPGIAWNGLQDVYSDWRLPKRGTWFSYRDTVYVEAGTNRSIGLKLRSYTGCVVDSVRKVSGSLPAGMHYTVRYDLTLKNPCVFGKTSQTGLYEPTFGVTYRDSAGKRWVEYYTLHLIVFDKDAAVEETNQTVEATLNGKGMRIALLTKYVSNYSVELISGSLPEGMELQWQQGDTEAYVTGRPSETGTFHPVFQVIDYKGGISNHKLTLKLSENRIIQTRQQMICLSGTWEATELTDTSGQVDFHDCYAIRVSDGEFPEGVSLRFTASDAVPCVVGSMNTIHVEDARYVTVNAFMNDGSIVKHKLYLVYPFRVHFDLNGHGYFGPMDQWVKDGGTAVEPSKPFGGLGLTFTGWYKNKADADARNGRTFDFDKPLVGGSRAITLYAGWEEQDIVYYNPYTPGSYGYYEYYDPDESVTEPEEPVRTGYVFLGWYERLSDSMAFRGFGKPAPKKTLNLYPKFTPELNGLSLSVESDTVAPGGTVKPTVSFDPWNAQPEVTWSVAYGEEAVDRIDADGTVHINADAPEWSYVTVKAEADGHEAFLRLTVRTVYPIEIATMEYDLTEISADNCADVFSEALYPDSTYAGVFSFDPETNTLTIHGDRELEGVSIRNNGLNGLKIRIDGSVTMEMAYDPALELAADTTLMGSGELNVICGEKNEWGWYDSEVGISVTNGATFRIEGMTVYCEGGMVGLSGSAKAAGVAGGDSKLVLRSTDLTAKSLHDPENLTAWGAAVSDFGGGLVLIDTELTAPADAVFEEEYGNLLGPDQMPVLQAVFSATAPLPAKVTVSAVVYAADGEPAVNTPVLVGDQVVYTDETGTYTAETCAGWQTVAVSDPCLGVIETAVEVSEPDPEQPETPVALTVSTVTTVTVRFDAGGGAGEMGELMVLPEQPFELPDCAFTAPDASMVFDGWDLGQPGDPVTVSEDTTLTALWRTEHVHTPEWIEGVEPDCESAGHLDVWYCPGCGRYFAERSCQIELLISDPSELEDEPLGHDWELVEWIWEEGIFSAEARFVCTRNETHERTEWAEVTSWTLPASGLDAGATVYHASVTLDGVEYTDECNVYDYDALPQDSLMDTEGHWMTWYLDVETNTLTVSGELGGEAVTVTALDGNEEPIGEALSITEPETPVSPAFPKGAAALRIEWKGQSETVDLTQLVPVPGDLNEDGRYDSTEALYLLLCAAVGGDYELYWDEAELDFDGNGGFDANDALWLLFNRVEFETPGAPLERFVLAAFEGNQMKRIMLLDAESAFPPEAAELLNTAEDVRLFFLGSGAAPIGGMLEIDRTTE